MQGVTTGLAAGLVALALGTVPAAGQESAASNWTGSYDFNSAGESLARAQVADVVKRAEAGYYETFGADQTTTIYDRSVGDVTVGDGSTAEIRAQTGEESGTKSYSVGAVNTSTNEITVTGGGNAVEVENRAASEGCQDGSISVSSVSGLDISAGATARTGGSRGC